MGHVVGIETVVAQLVVEDLERREVFGLRVPLAYLFYGYAQQRLAQGVARESVTEVPHGADGEDHILALQRPIEQSIVTGGYLLGGEQRALEERLRLLVAVCHYAAVTAQAVDPCRTEGYYDGTGLCQRLGSCTQPLRHIGTGRGRVGCGEGGVEVVAEVSYRVALHIPHLRRQDSVAILFLVRIEGVERLDGACHRFGVEEYARGRCRNTELGTLHTSCHVVGKARSERQQRVAVTDACVHRGNLHHRAEQCRGGR